MKIPLADVSTTESEISQVRDALNRGMISGTGPHVKLFEDLLSQTVGRKYALATNSGTMALVVLLQALGIGSGDKVLVSSFTFVAPAAACRLVGATPVLVDIDKESWTIDPKKAEEVIHRLDGKVKAIISVDFSGHPANYDALYNLCQKFGLLLVEDAAQAHGSKFRSKGKELLQTSCGSFGHGSIFSFFANKTITCGEGGAILVDDEALANECRLIMNHGMDARMPYHHTRIGRNGRLGNLQAAFGCGQMFRWAELITGKVNTIAHYINKLSGLPGLLPRTTSTSYDIDMVPWLMTLFVDAETAGMSARQLTWRLQERGIDSRMTFSPLHHPPQNHFYGGGNLHVAEHISENTLWLPTHQLMSEEIIDHVCQQIREILING